MQLSKAKLEAIKIIERDIANTPSTQNNIASELLKAIKDVIEIIKTHPRTRWGCGYKNSANNLSYVFSKALHPVLGKIKISSKDSLSDYLACINPTSLPEDIDRAERVIRATIPMFDNDIRDALDTLGGSLILLRAHFSPNQKNVKKSKDSPYCRYCYREARNRSDTCEDHEGIGRVDGKRKQAHYEYLRRQIDLARRSENIQNTFLLQHFRSLGISSWDGDPENIEWIKKTMTAIRACALDQSRINSLAIDLVEASKQINSPYSQKDWPSALEGTMLRYEVCELMKFRAPDKKLVEKLNRIWAGESVVHVAKIFGVSREPLQRRKSLWSKRVNEMRELGIADSIIKIVLGIKTLP